MACNKSGSTKPQSSGLGFGDCFMSALPIAANDSPKPFDSPPVNSKYPLDCDRPVQSGNSVLSLSGKSRSFEPLCLLPSVMMSLFCWDFLNRVLSIGLSNAGGAKRQELIDRQAEKAIASLGIIFA